jgi:hypothetical protein
MPCKFRVQKHLNFLVFMGKIQWVTTSIPGSATNLLVFCRSWDPGEFRCCPFFLLSICSILPTLLFYRSLESSGFSGRDLFPVSSSSDVGSFV